FCKLHGYDILSEVDLIVFVDCWRDNELFLGGVEIDGFAEMEFDFVRLKVQRFIRWNGPYEDWRDSVLWTAGRRSLPRTGEGEGQQSDKQPREYLSKNHFRAI